jgi:hypothetical protein
MGEGLAILSVIGIIALGIVTIIRTITDYKLKRRLIDKAEVNEGFSAALEESMKSIAPRVEQNRYPTLKWGLVFLSVGVGLIALHFLNPGMNSPLPFGIISASAALGFLIYYFIIRQDLQKRE